MAFRKGGKAAAKSSAKQYTVSTPVEYVKDGETQTMWIRLGTAFKLKDGEGFTLLLNALPLPLVDENGCVQAKLVVKEYDPDAGEGEGE